MNRAARILAVAVALVSILPLGACATSEQSHDGPLLEVDGDLLGRYWMVRQSKLAFDAPESVRNDCGDGFVLLRYVIDSQGQISQADVVHGEPAGCYEEAAMLLLQTWSFLPTPFNSRRTPVRVSQRIPFSTE